MADNLQKCGIFAIENEQGIFLRGKKKEYFFQEFYSTKKTVLIKCHDDHRIAFAFSALAFFGLCIS